MICADVAQYVRLMGEDEQATMNVWWSYRCTLIDPTVARHGGRLVKLTGDGFLAEMGSADEAVACALAIQEGVARRNVGVAAGRRMEFRIGINWCEVVADLEDIYGEGVNIAARLESLAEPGGVCVSQAIRDRLSSSSGAVFEDLGLQILKHVAEPVQAYRVRAMTAGVGSAAHSPETRIPSPV